MAQNDNKMIQVFGSSAAFATFYIALMVPTYVLPYFGSNSSIVNLTGSAFGLGMNPLFWVHLLILVGIIIITVFRGAVVDKRWIVVFPIIATVFDLTPTLSIIPFVPTVLHITVIVLGVSNSARKEPV